MKLKGHVFTSLFVLWDDGRRAICIYECTCGNTVSVESGNLLSGNTKSCGCRKRKAARLSVVVMIATTKAISTMADAELRCVIAGETISVLSLLTWVFAQKVIH